MLYLESLSLYVSVVTNIDQTVGDTFRHEYGIDLETLFIYENMLEMCLKE